MLKQVRLIFEKIGRNVFQATVYDQRYTVFRQAFLLIQYSFICKQYFFCSDREYQYFFLADGKQNS